MEYYLQSVALILVSSILALLVGGQSKIFGPLIGIGAGCLVLSGVIRYLQPVMELVGRIQDMTEISGEMMSILLKAVGISVISQLAELICTDAGQNTLGKAVARLSNAAILWVSIPLIEELLELIQEVLGT